MYRGGSYVFTQFNSGPLFFFISIDFSVAQISNKPSDLRLDTYTILPSSRRYIDRRSDNRRSPYRREYRLASYRFLSNLLTRSRETRGFNQIYSGPR